MLSLRLSILCSCDVEDWIRVQIDDVEDVNGTDKDDELFIRISGDYDSSQRDTPDSKMEVLRLSAVGVCKRICRRRSQRWPGVAWLRRLAVLLWLLLVVKKTRPVLTSSETVRQLLCLMLSTQFNVFVVVVRRLRGCYE